MIFIFSDNLYNDIQKKEDVIEAADYFGADMEDLVSD